jgi:23S rRNA pseudouridine1911/1915/1917 synthase
MKVKLKASKNYSSIETFLKAKGFSNAILVSYLNNLNLVKVNNKTPYLEDKITKGSIIEVALTKETNKLLLVNKPLEVLYEDTYLMIVNKVHNLSATPTKATLEYNLSGIIANYFRNMKINSKVHLVNRLDFETSGITLVAKHQFIHSLLNDTKVISKYRAKLTGVIKPLSGVIEKRISKLESSKERVESSIGYDSVTKYVVKNIENNESNVEAELVKGRSPQLRLHFKLMGHPIVGDKLYGGKGKTLHLQNFFIKFKHPITSRIISVKLKREWK